MAFPTPGPLWRYSPRDNDGHPVRPARDEAPPAHGGAATGSTASAGRPAPCRRAAPPHAHQRACRLGQDDSPRRMGGRFARAATVRLAHARPQRQRPGALLGVRDRGAADARALGRIGFARRPRGQRDKPDRRRPAAADQRGCRPRPAARPRARGLPPHSEPGGARQSGFPRRAAALDARARDRDPARPAPPAPAPACPRRAAGVPLDPAALRRRGGRGAPACRTRRHSRRGRCRAARTAYRGLGRRVIPRCALALGPRRPERLHRGVRRR